MMMTMMVCLVLWLKFKVSFFKHRHRKL